MWGEEKEEKEEKEEDRREGKPCIVMPNWVIEFWLLFIELIATLGKLKSAITLFLMLLKI